MDTQYTNRELFTVFMICIFNLILYIERFCTRAQSEEVLQFYQESRSFTMNVNSAYAVPFMLLAPVYGYLGDRFSRKKIMFVTICFWSAALVLGAFVKFGAVFYILTRGLVGTFQSGFDVVAPSVITDIVQNDALSIALTYFNAVIPIGALFGILLKELVAKHIGQWWWSLYIMSIISFASAVFLLLGVEPKRGFKEVEDAVGEGKVMKATSYKEDMRSMFHNKTYLLICSGLGCINLYSRILSHSGVELLILGDQIISEREHREQQFNVKNTYISITLITGLIGVPIGTYWCRLLRFSIPNIYPIISGLGSLLSVPFMGMVLLTADVRTWEAFYYLFYSQILCNMNYAVTHYTLQTCMIPTRRCTIRAWQVVVSRLIGGIIGPYFMQLVRSTLYATMNFDKLENRYDIPDIDIKPFYTLRGSVLIALVSSFVGSVLFLCDAVYVVEDTQKVQEEIVNLVSKQIEEEEKATSNVKI